MFKMALTTTAAVFIGFVIYLLIHLGMFKDVVIEQGTAPAMKLLYKEHVGSYYKINEKIQEVEQWAIKNNINCKLSFGEYFDDPDAVEENRLRSRGGCVVDADLENKPADFGFAEYPERKSILAIFSGSPSIGPFKVYSKVENYRLENRLIQAGSVIEVYAIQSPTEMTTRYYFPIK